MIIEEESDFFFPIETAEVLDSERHPHERRIIHESDFDVSHSRNPSRNLSNIEELIQEEMKL